MKSCKKIFTLLCASTLILAAGCQETAVQVRALPKEDTPLVVGSTAPPEAAEALQISEQEYPDKLEFTHTSEADNGSLEIVSEAEVETPDAGLPTVRVIPRAFDMDECIRYAELLFGNQAMYSAEDMKLQQEIADLKKALEDPDLPAASQAELKASLADAQAKLESLLQTPVTFSDTVTEHSDYTTIDMASDGSDGTFRRLQFTLAPDNSASSMQYLASPTSPAHVGSIWSTTISQERRQAATEFGDPDAIADPQISAQRAEAEALDLLSRLDLYDYSMQSCDLVFGDINGKVQKAWELEFTRNVENAPISFFSRTDDDFYALESHPGSDDNLQPVWPEEALDILVADSGIVRLRWNAPFEVTELLSNNTVVLPFEEIQAIVSEVLPMQYEHDASDSVSERIVVTRMTLGLGRILDESGASGTLLPVWNLYGTRTFSKDGNIDPSQRLDDLNEPLVSINAVDGSVIQEPAS